ncbi:MAG: magnesium and cobalt transport protein CorA, partial [Gammaproteobacteria bacterium]|nr:magnesium and cobalt transport protein CorA [Gammaproteobacteria bacterium]
GMNFEHMPELHVAHGYYVLLGLMVSIVAAQLVVFWRKGWF